MNKRIIEKVNQLLMTEYTEGDPLDGDDIEDLKKGLEELNGEKNKHNCPKCGEQLYITSEYIEGAGGVKFVTCLSCNYERELEK